MAYQFNGSTDYADILGVPQIATGVMAAWIRPLALPASGDIDMCWVNYEEGTAEQFAVQEKSMAFYDTGSSAVRFTARIFSSGSKIATGTTNISANTWYHVAMTIDGSNLKLWVNGTVEATTGAGAAYTGYTNPAFRVCGLPDAVGLGETSRTRANMQMAELVISTTVPDAAQIGALSKGYSPAAVLRGYADVWPMVRDNTPFKGVAMTLSGTSVVTHPRVIMPRRRPIGFAGTSPPPPPPSTTYPQLERGTRGLMRGVSLGRAA